MMLEFVLGTFILAVIFCILETEFFLRVKDSTPTMSKEERLETEVKWLQTQRYELQEKNSALETENHLLKNRTEYR